jgi:hypothetical protein
VIAAVTLMLGGVGGNEHHAALLGERRAGRRRSAVFRPLGDGQDDAFGGSVRRLIGDDEHGWSENGVFNFEHGCYAKVHGRSFLQW